jgi:hypothetical protein
MLSAWVRFSTGFIWYSILFIEFVPRYTMLIEGRLEREQDNEGLLGKKAAHVMS